MTVPCCIPATGEHNWGCFDTTDAAQCIEFWSGTPGPEGMKCYYHSTGEGCFDCNEEPDIGRGCCYPGDPNPVWWAPYKIGAFPANCTRCGGDVVDSEDDCKPQLPPPECREPEDDRVFLANPADLTGTRWTIDLIGVAAFGYGEDVGQDGLTKPVTANRLRQRPPVAGEPDSCEHAEGRYVILEDGLMYVETCSRPTGNPDSERFSYAGLMTAEGEERLDEGCQYFMGGVHLPWWTEANLRSHQYRCGGIPV